MFAIYVRSHPSETSEFDNVKITVINFINLSTIQAQKHGKLPYKHQKWKHVPRRSKLPLLTGHSRREPSILLLILQRTAQRFCMDILQNIQCMRWQTNNSIL